MASEQVHSYLITVSMFEKKTIHIDLQTSNFLFTVYRRLVTVLCKNVHIAEQIKRFYERPLILEINVLTFYSRDEQTVKIPKALF